MGDISAWGADKLNKVAFSLESPLTNVYLALINGAEPTAYLSGSEIAEVTGGAYAREQIPLNSTYWSASDYGRMLSKVEFLFPVATANWGRVRSWALCDAATGGNVVWYGKFKQGKRIRADDQVRIPAGAIMVQLKPGE